MSEWNPGILAAAEAMYGRLRLADPERYPKWKKLDIDSRDHYCIAAKNAITAFYRYGASDVPSDWESRL